jgi:hypothetical protein
MKCPICKGKGELPEPKRKFQDRRKEMAVVLLREGFGTREVQRFVGYKSPRSVSEIKSNLSNLPK